jgi:hypothetical protein
MKNAPDVVAFVGGGEWCGGPGGTGATSVQSVLLIPIREGGDPMKQLWHKMSATQRAASIAAVSTPVGAAIALNTHMILGAWNVRL